MLLVQLVHRERKVQPALKVQSGLLVQLELKALRVLRVEPVQPVQPVRKVLRALRGRKDQLDLQDRLA